MPNTLFHFAVQGPTSRLLFKNADFVWILTGCILPDIPWMAQRLVLLLHLFNPYVVRIYFTLQASLLFCLVLSLAGAFLAEKPLRIFPLLACNCLFHLLLDTIEIKWGNGVHLFVPLNWEMLQFNLIWPEHAVITLISIAGFLLFLSLWRETTGQPAPRVSFSRLRAFGTLCCLFLYIAAPLAFVANIEKANNRYIHTLRDAATRPGKYIEFDRIPYIHEKHSLLMFTGELIALQGKVPEKSALISLQGRFLNDSTITATAYHIHGNSRDLFSSLGVLLFCVAWGRSLMTLARQKAKNK